MENLQIAIIQSNILWEDIDGNLKKFSELISTINQPVDLIVLPEMFSTGFTMHSKTMAESMDGKTVNRLKTLAANTHTCITGSLIIEEEGSFFNRLVWVSPEGNISFYDKRHLFRMAKEHDHYTAGHKKLIVELKGWKICPLICYDLRFPVWARNKEDYDLLIFVANWPSPRKKAWQILLQARAIENLAYVIGVNRVGEDGNNFEFSGNSAVLDPKGDVISEIPEGEESMKIVSLSYNDLLLFREKFPAWMDADEFSLYV